MLHKALLSSPKEFRVSIGTQTYCTASVNKSSAMPGDLVTVTVRANTGYGNVTVAVSPSVEVTKVNETTFTFVMPFTDVVVNASASALDFRINVSKTGQGTVTVKSLAKYGEVVTVTASPSKGYELSSVTASGVTLSGSGDTRTFKMPAKDVTVNVTFEVVYKLTIGSYTGDGYRQFGYERVAVRMGELYPVPYWGSTGRYLISLLFSKSDGSSDCTLQNTLVGGDFWGGFTAYFEDGTSFSLPIDTDYGKWREGYKAFEAHNGETARIVFTTAPTGHL